MLHTLEGLMTKIKYTVITFLQVTRSNCWWRWQYLQTQSFLKNWANRIHIVELFCHLFRIKMSSTGWIITKWEDTLSLLVENTSLKDLIRTVLGKVRSSQKKYFIWERNWYLSCLDLWKGVSCHKKVHDARKPRLD